MEISVVCQLRKKEFHSHILVYSEHIGFYFHLKMHSELLSRGVADTQARSLPFFILILPFSPPVN